jgi:hypothetical protein
VKGFFGLTGALLFLLFAGAPRAVIDDVKIDPPKIEQKLALPEKE